MRTAALVKLGTLAVAATVLGAGISMAADVAPVYVPPPAAPEANPLEGFYLGGHAGYGWANRNGCWEVVKGDYVRELTVVIEQPVEYCSEPDFDYDQKGWLLGGQAGVNHFIGNSHLVIGAEVSASLTGITGNLYDVAPGYEGVGDWKWLATATGKLGFVFDRLMIYGEAGLGLGAFRYNAPYCNFESNHQGWVAGAGIEAALKNNNSVFVKYDHFDFKTKDASCGPGGYFPVYVSTKSELDVVKFGFNHYFH